MSRNKFARNQLEKHGWTEGSGLGKNETGIKDAIKVKLKHDSAGVGHNKGDEFTFQWWDHVFNKAASSISVKDSEEGVAVEKTVETGPVSSKKKKVYADKSMLYGQFVKGATLTNGTEDHIVEGVDSSEDEEEKLKMNRLMDDDMLERCGGMTAHKAARHGHKLSAKMARIVEQEKLELEKLKRKKECQSNSGRRRTRSQTSNEGTIEENIELESSKKKKKKKKVKEKDNDYVDDAIDEEIQSVKSKKKKGKERKVEANNFEINQENECEKDRRLFEKKKNKDKNLCTVEDEYDVCNDNRRKKKRKRKENSDDTYLVEEYHKAVEEKCETVLEHESESRARNYTENESQSESKKSKKKKKKMKVTEDNVDGLWMFL